MKSKLVDKVVELLETRPYKLTIRQIAEDTSIPAGWIRQLQRKQIKEPSCPRIETLYEYLNECKLILE